MQRSFRAVYDSSNEWGFPDLLPQPIDLAVPADVIPYAYRQRQFSARPVLLHFHIDDYKFDVVWNRPEREVGKLGLWAACSPDFSLWMDAPRAEQIWNIYRGRWCGRHWQGAGLTVIPSVNWAGKSSWDFCFAGVPSNQIVTLRVPSLRKIEMHVFLDGYYEMVDRLSPRLVLWFGNVPVECEADGVAKILFRLEEWWKRRKAVYYGR